MWPDWKKVEVLLKSLPVNLQERDFYEGLGVDGRAILEYVSIQGIELIRFRVGIIG